MACSIAARTCGVKCRRVLQRVVARWRTRRRNFMTTYLLPASGGAAAPESSATTAESTAAESSAPKSAAESAQAAAEAPATRVARPAAATSQSAEEGEQERTHCGEPRQQRCVAGDPHQQARAGGGEGRAQCASENPAQHHRTDENGEQDQRQGGRTARAPAGLPIVFGGRQRLTFDELHHLVEAGVDTAIVIPLAEGGPDGLGNDAVAHGIGQDAFEAIADLDAHVVIVLRNDQQRPVIHLVPAR